MVSPLKYTSMQQVLDLLHSSFAQTLCGILDS
jgi:hypothetical protein